MSSSSSLLGEEQPNEVVVVRVRGGVVVGVVVRHRRRRGRRGLGDVEAWAEERGDYFNYCLIFISSVYSTVKYIFVRGCVNLRELGGGFHATSGREI